MKGGSRNVQNIWYKSITINLELLEQFKDYNNWGLFYKNGKKLAGAKLCQAQNC